MNPLNPISQNLFTSLILDRAPGDRIKAKHLANNNSHPLRYFSFKPPRRTTRSFGIVRDGIKICFFTRSRTFPLSRAHLTPPAVSFTSIYPFSPQARKRAIGLQTPRVLGDENKWLFKLSNINMAAIFISAFVRSV